MEHSLSVLKAFELFDTPDFKPYEVLKWKAFPVDNNISKNLFKDFECDLPVAPGDFVCKREMLLNLLSFCGTTVIAARYDGVHPYYEFIKGLPYIEDVPDYKTLNEVGWHFFRIDENLYKTW